VVRWTGGVVGGEFVPVHYYQDDNGYLVYENTNTGKLVRVWDGDIASAVEICKDWHGGQSSPCYRLMSNDFSYRNLKRVLRELRQAQREADNQGVDDDDDYIDLLTTIEDLEGIVTRIDTIAD
jgi:hypothetical protein